SSFALMLGTAHLRLALEVVDRYLGRHACGLVRRLQLDRVVHDRELARLLGVLDLAGALLAVERRAIRADQRQPADRASQPAVELQTALAERRHRELFGLALAVPAHAIELLVVDLRL